MTITSEGLRIPIAAPPAPETLERIAALAAAFAADGWAMSQVVLSGNHIGMAATHTTATIGTTGVYKQAYYAEGTPYDLGYLIGRLAEPTVSRMTNAFLDDVVFSFVGISLPPWLEKTIGSLIADVAYQGAKRSIPDVPQAYQQELQGLYDGCLAANPRSQVTIDRLWTLNVGIDAALAFIYTLRLPSLVPLPLPLKPEHFRIPFMCTGYSLSGTDGTQPYHYFGRDFMFTTANVFQDTACPIIYRPEGGQPMVSLAAPGWMGSITALNAAGVGGSVNMAPSGLCNPERPGLNSLLLNRHAIQSAGTASEALDVMVKAQRGVSWIHILADGGANNGGVDTSYVVEAGMSQDTIPFMSYPPADLAGTVLAEAAAWVQQPSTPVQNGLMARSASYVPPPRWQTLNPGLFQAFKADPSRYHYDVQPTYTYDYNPADFTPDGFLDATWTTHNCPMGLYIAPPREPVPNLLVATNRFIVPEMQLTTMAEAADRVAQKSWDDVQWRYDELSSTVTGFVRQNGGAQPYITHDQARQAANYLGIEQQFPTYNNPHDLPADQVQIGGAVSLMDLKAVTMESHYGYYSDEWVTTTLKNYVV